MDTNNKVKSTSDLTQRKAALVAGFGLLIMTIAAMFSEFYARQGIIVDGDAATTAKNILENEFLFRAGIAGYLIVIICDVLVAWALYIFLKPINKSISLLTAWLRLAYSIIFAISLLNLFTALSILNPDYTSVFESNQLNAQVMLSLNAFNDGWNIGFIFFGLHLGFLGYLVYKSGYVHKLLGILIFIAGLGYFTDSLGKILSAEYGLEISIYTFIGELILMFWLLFKGGKINLKTDEDE